MVAAARTANRQLFPAHTLRFEPRYRWIQKAAAGGELGDVVQLSARRATWAPEGRMYGQRTRLELCLGVHDLDAMRCGAPARSTASMRKRHLAAYPVAERTLSLQRSSFDQVRSDCSSLVGRCRRRRESRGIRTSIALGLSAVYTELRGTRRRSTWVAGDLLPDLTYTFDIEGIPGGVVRVQDEHFVRAVHHPETWPGASVADARRAVEATLALATSADESRVVTLS